MTLDFYSKRRFVILRSIEGGMGVVHQLLPIATGDRVLALKTIKGLSRIQDFDNECDAWFSVAHHPNIARAFAYGRWNSLPSIVVDWYPTSLDGVRASELTGVQALNIMSGIVRALDYAYRNANFIHQDVKPSNIMVDESGRPRLSDFGISRCVKPQSVARVERGANGTLMTSSAEVAGTPFYMAPELWRGAKPSIATDVFSLGVTFFQWLALGHPYVENAKEPVFRDQVRQDALRGALHRKGDVAGRVERCVLKCLSLDPTRRYQSYEDLYSDLTGYPLQLQSPEEWTVARSEVAAGAAQCYLDRGETTKASALLRRALAERPNDALVLHSIAQVERAENMPEQAEKSLISAYSVLQRGKGMCDGVFIPRPAFGWAAWLINKQRQSDAAEVIHDILAWARARDGSDGGGKSELGGGAYPEVGWYLLYRGDFENASEELNKAASRQGLDKAQLIWTVLAAWLAGNLRHHADSIALKALAHEPHAVQKAGETEFVWARVLLYRYANPIIGHRLWETSPPYLLVAAAEMDKRAGLQPCSMLLVGKSSENDRPLATALDRFATGGRHHGHIQALPLS